MFGTNLKIVKHSACWMKHVLNFYNISKGSENMSHEYVFRWVNVGHEFAGLAAALSQAHAQKVEL